MANSLLCATATSHVAAPAGPVPPTRAEQLLLAAEDCCSALQLVQQAYNALERFNFLDTHMSPEEMPIDRAEFGALLALVNEAAMRRIDDTRSAVQRARGIGTPPPGK